MRRVIIDANIIINVWRQEIDPLTGSNFYKTSSDILELILNDKITGILLTTTAMEILHSVRVHAELSGKSGAFALKAAVRDISRSGLQLTIPDVGIMGMAYDLFMNIHTDPFDAIMVAAALNDSADAIISRDRRLKKKSSKVVSVLTPEEFLGKFPRG